MDTHPHIHDISGVQKTASFNDTGRGMYTLFLLL